MNTFKTIAVLALGAMTLFSCSKDDNDVLDGGGKKTKLTITVTGVNPDEGDFVSFVASGGTAANDKTLWKINGDVKNNETVVSLDADDFTGATKTYVIESTTNLLASSIGIQCINFGTAFKVSYKAEVNGKVENNDENVTVELNKDYTHNYSY